MAFLTRAFQNSSVKLLSDDINVFLTANPTFSGINVTLSESPSQYFAILLYETP